MFQNAVLFYSFDAARKYINIFNGEPENAKSYNSAFTAGVVAGAACTVVTTPVELVKVCVSVSVVCVLSRGVLVFVGVVCAASGPIQTWRLFLYCSA
jgi:hypothetical protein